MKQMTEPTHEDIDDIDIIQSKIRGHQHNLIPITQALKARTIWTNPHHI